MHFGPCPGCGTTTSLELARVGFRMDYPGQAPLLDTVEVNICARCAGQAKANLGELKRRLAAWAAGDPGVRSVPGAG